MKKLIVYLLSSFFIVPILFAQNKTNKEILYSAARSFNQGARSNFSKAVMLAKEKGWAIDYKSNRNARARLMGVDQNGLPKYYISFVDPVQAVTIGVNKVWPNGISKLALTGASDLVTNKIGIWDEGGSRITHKEFEGRITPKDVSSEITSHSTHVTGIILNKGLNAQAKGMAYGLKGVLQYDWNNDLSEMAEAAGNGLLISNHSYGIVAGWNRNDDSARWEFNGRFNEKEDFRFGLYDEEAEANDSIAYNAPNYLIVKAAGNNRTSNGPFKLANGKWYNDDSTYWRRNQSGRLYNAGVRPDSLSSNEAYETISTDLNAKNVLTIGAVGGIPAGYSKKEDVLMASFSSWGPTDDGRIKPDLVAQGIAVFSSTSDNDSSYDYKSGTSMAAPAAAGGLLLLQELSQKFTLNGSPRILKSATIKALAIHTANEAGANPGPDYKFGWGLLNINEAALTLNNALSNNNSSNDLLYENVLLNKDSLVINFLASGLKPIKATMVWTDIKGIKSNLLDDTSPKLVNDLDLKISKGSNTYYPWKLDPTNPEQLSVRGVNSIDNVEKVEIDSAQIGATYRLTVSHKGNLERNQQAYSLIISGAGGKSYCSSQASSTAGSRIDSTHINNISFSNQSTDQYIDNSNLYILGEANGVIPVFLKLGSIDASNNTRFVKIFIDYNNNSIFEVSELAYTSEALTNANLYANITLPNNLVANTITKLRIVLSETASAANVSACGVYTIGETQDYTLKIVNPSNDLQMAEILNPTGGVFEKQMQYVTVKIINKGASKQTNFPITVTVKKGSTTILSTTEVFTGRLYGFETMNYTFQKPIAIESNQSYAIVANVALSNDQDLSNNSIEANLLSAASNNLPAGTANNCNGLTNVKVVNPSLDEQYIWYDSSSLSNPIAIGSSTSFTSNKNQLFLKKGYQEFVGPLNNTTLSNAGGYNNWSSDYGQFIRLNTKVPIQLETTKIYTGYAGKIELELRYLTKFTDSNYSYLPSMSKLMTLHVGASSPSPTLANGPTGTAAATPFVKEDSGRIYALNLKLTQPGDYILIARCADSATIFRNNGISTANYPFGNSNLFSINGNWVGADFQNFYYFFYNLQVSTPSFAKEATNVPVLFAAKPSLQIKIDTSTKSYTIQSSKAESYQWYLNDEAISGATEQNYQVNKNGLYKVAATIGTCQNFSENKLVMITSIIEAPAKEIGLKIFSTDFISNVIKGNNFYTQFNNIRDNRINIEIMNTNGVSLFYKENLTNQSSPQLIQTPSFSTGIYIIKIYANNKTYIQRVFVTNN